MVTTFYLVRHGMTVGGEEKRYKGQTDVPLSKEGEAQAEKVAEYLAEKLSKEHTKGRSIRFYSSDLSRAVKTAEIIAAPFGALPVMDPIFKERHFGRWEGMTFDEIRDEFPEEFDSWAANPLQFSPMGGESTADVDKRVMPHFYDILQKERSNIFFIVAHGGVNRVILCNLLCTSLEHIFKVEQDFACFNRIDFFEDTHVVKSLNTVVY